MANPFGLMLPPFAGSVQLAREMGARYFRPAGALRLDDWSGTCAPCDKAKEAGLELVLTLANSGGINAQGQMEPSVPPQTENDWADYRWCLRDVLDVYPASVVVVENEENSGLFYAGDVESYARQLDIAARAAHHHGLKSTNGGLVSTLVAWLVYQHYLEQGRVDEAESFAARSLTEQQLVAMRGPVGVAQIAKGRALLDVYGKSRLSYVNFHWYIADTEALGEAVAYLGEVTGKPVITNEIGQTVDDPEVTTRVLQKALELGLEVAVYYGLDGPHARGLMETDGTLRASGMAFREFVAGLGG